MDHAVKLLDKTVGRFNQSGFPAHSGARKESFNSSCQEKYFIAMFGEVGADVVKLLRPGRESLYSSSSGWSPRQNTGEPGGPIITYRAHVETYSGLPLAFQHGHVEPNIRREVAGSGEQFPGSSLTIVNSKISAYTLG